MSETGTAERRSAIMKCLCRRRHDTVSNLAFEFGVSERTIRRDIEVMSLTEPVYTQTGRYGGGIYVTEGYDMNKMYHSEKETALLQKLYDSALKREVCILTTAEYIDLRRIITDYAKPQISNT